MRSTLSNSILAPANSAELQGNDKSPSFTYVASCTFYRLAAKKNKQFCKLIFADVTKGSGTSVIPLPMMGFLNFGGSFAPQMCAAQ